jgi:hypothetical protein
MASISTTINTTQGVVSSLDETPEITFGSDTSVVFSGSVDFSAASVTGLTVVPNVAELNDSFSTSETYNCSGNVRVFKYNALAINNNWAVAAVTNLTISDNQGTTIRILGSTASDRTVTLTGMTVNGVAATVNPGSVKAKQKGSGIALDVVKSGGAYFVFGSSLVAE